MNKKELIEKVAEKTGLSKKQTEIAVNAILEIISDALKEKEPVALMGFGTFVVRSRAPRMGRNPRTGQTIKVSGADVPAFKPGRSLVTAVHGGPTGGGGPGKKGD